MVTPLYTYISEEATVVVLDVHQVLVDAVLEQDRDDSNMDSLGLLMMLGCIAENNIITFVKKYIIKKYFFRNLPKR